MAEFETIEKKEIKLSGNKFLEIARKKVKTENGESEFISISKGYVNKFGKRKFKASLGFPEDVAKEVAEALSNI